MSKSHIYGLDSLRAIAALIVVLSHIELVKESNKITNCFSLMPSGHTGVILFFVISGFLITSLLLQEQIVNKSISIKKFYLRRILRIWPLYYLVLFISVILFNYKPEVNTVVLCLTILPNIAHVLNCGWAVNPPVWSIGVEEQFYLIWPSLIKFAKSKILLILILIVIGYTILPHILLFIIKRTNFANSNVPNFINLFFASAKFNCMALGGILAYLIHYNSKVLIVIRNKYLSKIFILIPFILWGFNFEFYYFTD
ncbi:MAG: acyltransferase, partial [Bacteroidetes bacterium]|nr:acyltransferase [Bacteroidota bacterium]